jgi:uncharacterized protein (TIGR00297 family)
VIGLGLFLALLIAISELMQKKFPDYQEGTRKLVHILTGLLVALTPYLVQSRWPLLMLGLFFVIFNAVSIQKGWLSGMHNTLRPTLGTVFYPISFIILLLWLWDGHRFIVVSAMLIMAVGDALAALVGRHVRKPHLYSLGPEKKSWQGSITMFLTSMAIVLVCIRFCSGSSATWPVILWAAGVTAFLATACEAISFNGSDNLTVPLGAAFVLHYFSTHVLTDMGFFTFGMLLALLLAIISYRLKFLNSSGSATMFLLGTLFFGVGRWTWSIPILTFFILSSLLSKTGTHRKQRYADVVEKGGSRDIWQVLANGGLAGVMLLIWYVKQNDTYFILFAGSLAAVTADTWATELGMLSRTKPRSILTFRPVAPGTSGGISLLGTLGAAMGALVLAGVSLLCSPNQSPAVMGMREALLVFVAGLLASMVDSVLGATLQARYRCGRCGKETEKRVHCQSVQTEWIGGWSWMNNDVVNILAALSGIIMVWLMLLLSGKV